MDKDSVYYRQVRLLIKMLPVVAEETVFALKGGTAINLFVRNFPRLSVDIDLAYLPMEPREEALSNARAALLRLVVNINAMPINSAVLQGNNPDELRIIVTGDNAQIKIEVSPVARGTLHEPVVMPVVEQVEEGFGYTEIQVVSLPDLYGGKLCAAMDRQHPRDLFDVNLLLAEQGINRALFVGFLTYVLSHPRPIHEVMAPRWKLLNANYQNEFDGMTVDPMDFNTLMATRKAMVTALQAHITAKDCEFLLSFKQGRPDWGLFDEPGAAGLPAIRWKQMNIQKLAKNKSKHSEQVANLKMVLAKWLAKENVGPV
jgi:predicted nucleotidyltransferase component of viral defense system